MVIRSRTIGNFMFGSVGVSSATGPYQHVLVYSDVNLASVLFLGSSLITLYFITMSAVTAVKHISVVLITIGTLIIKIWDSFLLPNNLPTVAGPNRYNFRFRIISCFRHHESN